MKKVEFARVLQCSPGAITALLKKGMPGFSNGRRAGVAWTAHHLCTSLNNAYPELLVGMPFEDVPAKDRIIVAKLAAIALIEYLMTGWCEYPLEDAAKLGLPLVPEIPYDKIFGKDADEAREFVADFRAEWDSLD